MDVRMDQAQGPIRLLNINLRETLPLKAPLACFPRDLLLLESAN